MSDDLGPFAIRRIEPGTPPGTSVVPLTTGEASAASVLRHAAEACADRVTGEVERDSPADRQIAETIRIQSAAIDAGTIAPLLGALSVPPPLIAPARAPDANAPSIDPSADAMRTSVFHPLADLPVAPGSTASSKAGRESSDRPTDKSSGRLQPLLDQFLPSTARSHE